MSLIWMILLFLLIAVLSDQLDGKKKRPRGGVRLPRVKLPPSVPQPWGAKERGDGAVPIPFEIPELRGAPTSVYREQGEALEETFQAQREMERQRERQAALAQRRAEQAAEGAAAPMRSRGLLPVITPENAQQAVVLAELLGKPKAMRSRR